MEVHADQFFDGEEYSRNELIASSIEKREFPEFFQRDSVVFERNLLEKWGTHRG